MDYLKFPGLATDFIARSINLTGRGGTFCLHNRRPQLFGGPLAAQDDACWCCNKQAKMLAVTYRPKNRDECTICDPPKEATGTLEEGKGLHSRTQYHNKQTNQHTLWIQQHYQLDLFVVISGKIPLSFTDMPSCACKKKGVLSSIGFDASKRCSNAPPYDTVPGVNPCQDELCPAGGEAAAAGQARSSAVSRGGGGSVGGGGPAEEPRKLSEPKEAPESDGPAREPSGGRPSTGSSKPIKPMGPPAKRFPPREKELTLDGLFLSARSSFITYVHWQAITLCDAITRTYEKLGTNIMKHVNHYPWSF